MALLFGNTATSAPTFEFVVAVIFLTRVEVSYPSGDWTGVANLFVSDLTVTDSLYHHNFGLYLNFGYGT